jgi:hypothetical protein
MSTQLEKTAAWQALDSASDAHGAAKAGKGDKAQAAQRLSEAAKTWAQASKPERVKSEAVVPFGKNKGQLISEAATKDLEWIAGALRRSIDDPEKSRWISSNQTLLAEIETELDGR